MGLIKFVQYLRPYGRRKEVTVERPDNIVDMADVVLQRGGVFEIEVLTTGVVSMTIEPSNKDELETFGPWAHELIENGLGVSAAVDRLVRRAYEYCTQKTAV